MGSQPPRDWDRASPHVPLEHSRNTHTASPPTLGTSSTTCIGFVADDTKYANDTFTRPPCPFSLPEAQLLSLASVQCPQRYAVDEVIER